MAGRLLIHSTFLSYLVALSAIKVIPCSIAVKGYICVGLANYLALLHWRLICQPPLLQAYSHLWYIEVGCNFLTDGLHTFLNFVIRGMHIIARRPILHVNIIQQSVSLHILCICFLELGYILIALSHCATEHAQLIVIMCLVSQFGIWHAHQGMANQFICDIDSFIFGIVWTVNIIYGIPDWHIWWLFPMPVLIFATSVMYHFMFIRKQNELPWFHSLMCFVRSLLYCMAMSIVHMHITTE